MYVLFLFTVIAQSLVMLYVLKVHAWMFAVWRVILVFVVVTFRHTSMIRILENVKSSSMVDVGAMKIDLFP